MKGCVKTIHNFRPEMAFWLEMAFCQILSQDNCIIIILLSNKSALLLKVLKGLARL